MQYPFYSHRELFNPTSLNPEWWWESGRGYRQSSVTPWFSRGSESANKLTGANAGVGKWINVANGYQSQRRVTNESRMNWNGGKGMNFLHDGTSNYTIVTALRFNGAIGQGVFEIVLSTSDSEQAERGIGLFKSGTGVFLSVTESRVLTGLLAFDTALHLVIIEMDWAAPTCEMWVDDDSRGSPSGIKIFNNPPFTGDSHSDMYLFGGENLDEDKEEDDDNPTHAGYQMTELLIFKRLLTDTPADFDNLQTYFGDKYNLF